MTTLHPTHTQAQRLRADASLVLVAAVWGSAFVAQRMAAEEIGPFAFNAARFVVGAAVLVPIVVRSRPRRALENARRAGALLGVLLFGGAALQQIGLQETTAGKAGFITGLYIVIVPLLLRLVWRERGQRAHWIGAGVATTGLFLLSVQSDFQMAPGDGWVLLSAIVWSLHVIAIGRVAPRQDAAALALVQYLTCSALSAAAALGVERDLLANTVATWPEIAYTGVLSIGLGYTLQVRAQRHTPPSHAAILLSLESVFAALFGWLWLAETLSPQQVAGCGLMLAGMGLAQAQVFRQTQVGGEAGERA